MRRGSAKVTVESGSGNVFADLGLHHPEQELLKSRLTLQIYRLIRARGLKQAEARKILGIKQPHVSALMRNRSGSFSVERLTQFLTALGQDVEITVRPTRKQHGEISVVGVSPESILSVFVESHPSQSARRMGRARHLILTSWYNVSHASTDHHGKHKRPVCHSF